MSILDYAILLAYLIGILILGLAVSRRHQSRGDFLLAGRSMKWFVVGASIMATVFSVTNFTGFAGEVFGHGLYVTLAIPVFVLVALPVLFWVMPFYHRMKAVSAYEFLERNFDLRVRRLASALFIVWRVAWMAVALYATGRLLSGVTGINLYSLILITGAITTAYTATGGMRSVMITDVAQCLVLLVSLAIAVASSVHAQHGILNLLHRSSAAGLLKPFHPFDPSIFSLDPRIRMTFWSVLIGTFTAFLARYGADQKVVQRYFAAKSLDDAKRGFVLNIAFAIFALLCLGLLGLGANAWAAAAGILPAKGEPAALLGRFVASLPPGACGLLVAGLIASTMSSVNAGVHSCYTAIRTDFLNRRPASTAGDDTLDIHSDRVLTLSVGALATFLACFVGNLGTIFEIANKVINGLGSPLLALVLLGLFRRGLTSTGMLVGGIAGILASVAISGWVSHLALHYYAVANLLVTVALCYGFSLVLPAGSTAISDQKSEIR